MDFQEFEKQITKIEKMELPGLEAQLKMAPMGRLKELRDAARKMNNAKKAGVMALFYPSSNQQTHIALILRKTYKGVHSAQVGFPGGKLEEEDTSLQDAALRETEEEIGVPQNVIQVLKELSEVYIPPSNFFVQPYLGITDQTPNFILEEDEVEELIEVDLNSFMDDSCITTEVLSTSYATEWVVPAYKLNGHIVWGATAMMLSEIREMLFDIL